MCRPITLPFGVYKIAVPHNRNISAIFIWPKSDVYMHIWHSVTAIMTA